MGDWVNSNLPDYPVTACNSNKTAIPIKIVRKIFLLRQATKIASTPAIKRKLPQEISTVPPGASSSGTIIAVNAAGGTKRRARCNPGGTEKRPNNKINDNRVTKVTTPTITIVTQNDI